MPVFSRCFQTRGGLTFLHQIIPTTINAMIMRITMKYMYQLRVAMREELEPEATFKAQWVALQQYTQSDSTLEQFMQTLSLRQKPSWHERQVLLLVQVRQLETTELHLIHWLSEELRQKVLQHYKQMPSAEQDEQLARLDLHCRHYQCSERQYPLWQDQQSVLLWHSAQKGRTLEQRPQLWDWEQQPIQQARQWAMLFRYLHCLQMGSWAEVMPNWRGSQGRQLELAEEKQPGAQLVQTELLLQYRQLLRYKLHSEQLPFSFKNDTLLQILQYVRFMQLEQQNIDTLQAMHFVRLLLKYPRQPEKQTVQFSDVAFDLMSVTQAHLSHPSIQLLQLLHYPLGSRRQFYKHFWHARSELQYRQFGIKVLHGQQVLLVKLLAQPGRHAIQADELTQRVQNGRVELQAMHVNCVARQYPGRQSWQVMLELSGEHCLQQLTAMLQRVQQLLTRQYPSAQLQHWEELQDMQPGMRVQQFMQLRVELRQQQLEHCLH